MHGAFLISTRKYLVLTSEIHTDKVYWLHYSDTQLPLSLLITCKRQTFRCSISNSSSMGYEGGGDGMCQ